MAQYQVGSPDDGWAATLQAAKDAAPLVATAAEAIAPLAALGLDVKRTQQHLHSKRRWAEEILVRERMPGYDVEHVLTIYAYTVEEPFVSFGGPIYRMVNTEMHSPSRGSGAGGFSDRLRACMLYIKMLWVALEALPEKFHFTGKVFRGEKWAFPTPQDHDPEAHFHVDRIFYWYEFKSSSTTHSVMYDDCFCGNNGPRTIFHIEGVKCFRIQAFSAVQGEEEALFLPLSTFVVQKSLARLREENGVLQGFPDDIHLVAPGQMAESIPVELKLAPGKEVIDMQAEPLGAGSYADVRQGTYVFSGQASPTVVAFKIFRGSQALDKVTPSPHSIC